MNYTGWDVPANGICPNMDILCMNLCYHLMPWRAADLNLYTEAIIGCVIIKNNISVVNYDAIYLCNLYYPTIQCNCPYVASYRFHESV